MENERSRGQKDPEMRQRWRTHQTSTRQTSTHQTWQLLRMCTFLLASSSPGKVCNLSSAKTHSVESRRLPAATETHPTQQELISYVNRPGGAALEYNSQTLLAGDIFCLRVSCILGEVLITLDIETKSKVEDFQLQKDSNRH